MRIDRYEVYEEVTREGSSVIYRAQDPNLRREVSIRVLDAAQDDIDLGRFRTSAQALARLRHEGIVCVHSMGVHGGCPYLVMDHVKGRSLGERVRRQGPLRSRDAAEVAYAVAKALEYAHGRGVLHRDVRPEHVILTPGGQALISDFSLAKGVEEGPTGLTRSDTWQSSSGYLAPEQVEGREDLVGPVTDVYGLGATLYFALTGQAPFAEDLPGDRRPRLRSPSELVPDVAGALDQICLTALHNDPDQRYPHFGALGEDLERYLHGRGLSKRSRRSWSLTLPAGREALPVLAALGVVVVGGGIGFASALWTRSGGTTAAPPPPVETAHAVGGDPGSVSPAESPTSSPPEDRDALLARAEELCAEGIRLADDDEFDDALRVLSEALELNPDHVMARAWRAFVHAAERRWAPALDDAGAALGGDPYCAKALEARVMVLTSTGRWPDALAEAERWAKLEPDNVDPYSIRGVILSQTGRYAEAMVYLEQAIRMQPYKARLYANRALCRLQSGDAQAALRDFDQAAELFDDPQYQPFTNRGMCYLKLDDLDAAVADFERGCELEPDDANNWNCLAVGYLEQDDTQAALRAFTQAIKVEPEFFDAIFNRARINMDLGRYRDADADLRRALKIAPPEDRRAVTSLMRKLEERALGRR